MRIGKFKVSKKAVSPVIATLLMIAVAVAASVIVYVWSAGLLGSLMGGGGSQVREQLTIEAYDWTGATLILYVRNVGAASVNVSTVYIGGTPATTVAKVPTGLIGVGATQQLTCTPAAAGTSGLAYTVKIATATGGLFSTSVICGQKS